MNDDYIILKNCIFIINEVKYNEMYIGMTEKFLTLSHGMSSFKNYIVRSLNPTLRIMHKTCCYSY